MSNVYAQPILALDTSAGASVCLLMPDGEVCSDKMITPRAHSKELLPLLHGLLIKKKLSWQDIGAFAVGVGPGSFTGLRVACATIAGINASLKRPVHALCSLHMTLQQTHTTQHIWSIEDARSGLVYAAQYQAGKVITPASCMTWHDFLALDPAAYITNSPLPHNLATELTEKLATWQAITPNISREQALAAVVKGLPPVTPSAAHVTWVEPVYLQASQAEKNLSSTQRKQT